MFPMHDPSRTTVRFVGLIALVVALASLVGCGTGAQNPEPLRSPGCGASDVAPGDYEAVNAVDDANQIYWVVVPEAYTGDDPVPLYLKLASGGGDAYANYAAWRPLIDDPGGLFVVAGTRTPAETEVATYEALLERLSNEYCVDLNRVHLFGSSSSSALTARLVCQMPGTFASFADSLGSFNLLGDCVPEPTPLVSITGDDDRSSVTGSVAVWAEINGCDLEPVAVDLGEGITRYTYEGCVADTVLYDFDGMGHQLPDTECVGPAGRYCAEYSDFETFSTYAEFFAEHPLG